MSINVTVDETVYEGITLIETGGKTISLEEYGKKAYYINDKNRGNLRNSILVTSNFDFVNAINKGEIYSYFQKLCEEQSRSNPVLQEVYLTYNGNQCRYNSIYNGSGTNNIWIELRTDANMSGNWSGGSLMGVTLIEI